MNAYSIRFIHWLLRVRNDTIKQRNSWDIYLKGCIINYFPITTLFLLGSLCHCSPASPHARHEVAAPRGAWVTWVILGDPRRAGRGVPSRHMPPHMRCPALGRSFTYAPQTCTLTSISHKSVWGVTGKEMCVQHTKAHPPRPKTSAPCTCFTKSCICAAGPMGFPLQSVKKSIPVMLLNKCCGAPCVQVSSHLLVQVLAMPKVTKAGTCGPSTQILLQEPP